MIDGVSRTTFPLLMCESCGRSSEPLGKEMPQVVSTATVLRCGDCGSTLTALECWLSGGTLVNGHWVATLADL